MSEKATGAEIAELKLLLGNSTEVLVESQLANSSGDFDRIMARIAVKATVKRAFRRTVPKLLNEIKSLQADTAKLVEALDCAEGAIADAIGCEDGLDGATGYAALTMLWPLMDAHGVMARPRQRAKFQAMYEGHAKVKRDIVSVENAELQCEAVQHNTEYLEMSELLAKWGREVEDLQAVVKQLPKCWRLNEAGERVRDVPVVPGMEVFWFWPDVPERGAVLKHEVMAIHQDGVTLRAVYHSTPGRGETPMPVSQISSTEAAARAANKAT